MSDLEAVPDGGDLVTYPKPLILLAKRDEGAAALVWGSDNAGGR